MTRHLDEVDDKQFDGLRAAVREFLTKTVADVEGMGLCSACLCRLVEAEASNMADELEEARDVRTN